MKTIASIYKSITESKGSIDNKGHWENDNVDGKDFNQKDKFYKLELDFIYDVLDDSDFNRETGYGKHTSAKYVSTEDFEIVEMASDGQKIRETEEIKKDMPELYKNLLLYAKSEAIESLDI